MFATPNLKTVEIISIGDELLIGQTVNTNASWLGAKLTQIGFKISRVVTIGDTDEEIRTALDESKVRAKLAIVTGGLGPTTDDITKRTLADYFGRKLVRDGKVLNRISTFFEDRGYEMLEVNRQQADLPSDTVILDNKRGTASGMWFEQEGFTVVSLPGVPYEMRGIMRDHGFDLIQQKFDGGSVSHRTVHTVGIGESFLADKIKDWANSLEEAGMTLAYLPSPGMVKLRVSAHNGTDAQMASALDAKVVELQRLIPKDNLWLWQNVS